MSTYLSIPKITANWLEANQSYLMRTISHVEEILQHHIHKMAEAANSNEIERSKQNRGLEADSENFVEDSPNFYCPTTESSQSLFALEQLCNIFNLSLFERNVLLLCTTALLNHEMIWLNLERFLNGLKRQFISHLCNALSMCVCSLKAPIDVSALEIALFLPSSNFSR